MNYLKNIPFAKYPLLLWWAIWFIALGILFKNEFSNTTNGFVFSLFIHLYLLLATWSSYQNIFFNSKTENSHTIRIVYIIILTCIVYYLQIESIDFLPDNYNEVKTLAIKANRLLFIYNFLSLCFAIYFNWINKSLKEKLEYLEKEKTIEKERTLSEIALLKQQLQPHFLFNSLNSINSLIRIEPAKAEEMTNKLSEFFRQNLKNQQQKIIQFKDELILIKSYLEIEQIRFEDRLKLNFFLEESCFEKEIPALITQPLIENAIKHGIYSTLGNVEIEIEAKVENDRLILKISNTCEENTLNSNKKGSSFGINSVKKRLFLTYGINNLLNIHKTENKFFVELYIPQKQHL